MKYLLSLILFCCLLLNGILINAQPKQLKIGTSTGYPPYYFIKNGKLVGLCIDIINYSAEELGIEVVYEQFPWNRMLHNAKTGKVDAIMPLFKTKEREAFLFFPKQAWRWKKTVSLPEKSRGYI